MTSGVGPKGSKANPIPLVNSHVTMERSTIFNGKIHYFDWAIFNSKLFVYQRVSSNKWETKQLKTCRIHDPSLDPTSIANLTVHR